MEAQQESTPDWHDAIAASEKAQDELDERIDAPGRVEKRRYTRAVTVSLDDAMLADMAREMAEKCAERDAVEEKKKAAAKRAGDQIKELDEEISALAAQVREGEAQRDLEVAEVWDEQQGLVLLFRADTKELIEKRAMTGAERQGQLDYSNGEGEAAEAAAIDGLGEGEPEPDDDPDDEDDDILDVDDTDDE